MRRGRRKCDVNGREEETKERERETDTRRGGPEGGKEAEW